MKKIVWVLILVLMPMLSLAACGGLSDDDIFDEYDVSLLGGRWQSEDGSTILYVGDDGEFWYHENGDLVFRGDLEQITLSPEDDGFTYIYRFDCHSDDGQLLFSCHYDTQQDVILEKNGETDTLNTYIYLGSLRPNQTEFIGYWYIQGVSDAYCISIKADDTWQLRYPGADGQLLVTGVCDPDDFGDYDLDIDQEAGINFGSAQLEDGRMAVGVNIYSPYQLDPFMAYYFYRSQDSRPRLSVGDYTGWWRCAGTTCYIELLEDGSWSMLDGWSDTPTAGVYESTDSGVRLTVQVSNSVYVNDGDVLDFGVQENGALYDPYTTFTIAPCFKYPD